MQVSANVAIRACEQAFARLCDLGRGVPEQTPAAGFLAAAARQIDAARAELTDGAEVTATIIVRLQAASAVLDDVALLSQLAPLDDVEEIAVLVDDLRVTLERRRDQGVPLEDG